MPCLTMVRTCQCAEGPATKWILTILCIEFDYRRSYIKIRECAFDCFSLQPSRQMHLPAWMQTEAVQSMDTVFAAVSTGAHIKQSHENIDTSTCPLMCSCMYSWQVLGLTVVQPAGALLQPHARMWKFSKVRTAARFANTCLSRLILQNFLQYTYRNSRTHAQQRRK